MSDSEMERAWYADQRVANRCREVEHTLDRALDDPNTRLRLGRRAEMLGEALIAVRDVQAEIVRTWD